MQSLFCIRTSKSFGDFLNEVQPSCAGKALSNQQTVQSLVRAEFTVGSNDVVTEIGEL